MWLELEVAVREPEAALLDDADVAALDLEHVEVVEEALSAVEAPAGLGDGGEPVAALQLLRAQHFAVEELEDECVVLGHRGDERCADAGLGRAARVVRLVLAVDREQAGVLAGDPDDVAATRRRDLVVRVRQAARQRLDRRRVAQLRHRLQHVLERHRAIL